MPMTFSNKSAVSTWSQVARHVGERSGGLSCHCDRSIGASAGVSVKHKCKLTKASWT